MSNPLPGDRRPLTQLETDVLVVGGGAAGLAVACTTGRQGLDVVLLERHGFCGGAPVAGFSGTVCGLFLSRQGAAGGAEKIVYGFVDDLIRTLQSCGGLTQLVRYGETYTLVREMLV